MDDKQATYRKPTLFQALVPIITLVLLLTINIQLWKDDSIAGPNQMALILSTVVAGIVSFRLGVPWLRMRRMMVKNIGDAMPSILILLMIGALSGTWMISGIVPTLIYYGLAILNPSIFPVAALLVASLVSLATGSSWSTIATIGVALLGIGTAMGFSPALVAGAIISGAYFGDKMSPLSDTTNLAPAMAGTDIFTHIRYMLITTTPTYILSLLIFMVIGFFHHDKADIASIGLMQDAIGHTFHISAWLLIVPLILIILIVSKRPPLPSLFVGALLGAVAAVIAQSQLIRSLDGGVHAYYEAAYRVTMQAFFGPTTVVTGNEQLNALLSTRGMAGMLDTIWLIIAAMAFSGMMESGKMLVRMAEAIVHYARSSGSLVAATVASAIFMNITASEQYISIVVPGRMYARIYRRMGFKPELLSRSLEDGGTVTSVLVPWNTGGAVNASVLGVPTIAYLPYAFFNLISPLMSIFIATVGYKIHRYSPKEMEKIQEEENRG